MSQLYAIKVRVSDESHNARGLQGASDSGERY